MPNVPELSLILPCYNEAGHLHTSMQAVLDTLAMMQFSWEIILVEDGSKDNTRQLLKEFEGKPNITVIYHEKNSGRGAAVKTGIRAAKGVYCGFIDIDLEVHCIYIAEALRRLRGGADMVIGYRTYKPLKAGLFRHFLSSGYSALIRTVLGLPDLDTESGYKFFKTDKARDLITRTPDNHWFWDTEITMMALHEQWNIVQIPVLFVRNPQKTSTVRVIPDTLDYFKKSWQFRKRLKELRRQAAH